ncbi:2-oxo-4-hydroxy-4-carboxy-5-ureidoimidazoline decarboxylase [Cohnella laeviribosi]|uniref:2-oxo-4-hydroxy-4-carboxy-5-ureidoimidazoline decarboxylase n=1 Tax=Cohnella laeviribosi TaxID=380174 RepID=UPI00036D0B54|nr:2-oxo-4-hydroxy-4-carboxy-5-ureidoimidazoline decarboxylase [Cohnella laeviribosi]
MKPTGQKITLQSINRMDRSEFVEALGGIFECSPWVAEDAWTLRPFASVRELHEAMMGIVRGAPQDRIDSLLLAHPDLGTRLAVSGYSAAEQQSAGLSRLTQEEYERFHDLNKRYVGKFGFPFILAVRGKSKSDILAAMQERISRSAAEERERALSEIGRIAGFRLADLIHNENDEPGRTDLC